MTPGSTLVWCPFLRTGRSYSPVSVWPNFPTVFITVITVITVITPAPMLSSLAAEGAQMAQNRSAPAGWTSDSPATATHAAPLLAFSTVPDFRRRLHRRHNCNHRHHHAYTLHDGSWSPTAPFCCSETAAGALNDGNMVGDARTWTRELGRSCSRMAGSSKSTPSLCCHRVYARTSKVESSVP